MILSDLSVIQKCKNNFERIKYTFVTTFLIGMVTHGYMFANAITNRDNIKSFMRVSGTWTSGRWLLGILSKLNEIIFGTAVSVPWLIGIIGCIWLALSACAIVEGFDVKKKSIQILIGTLLITFPSVTSTYTYMFTSAYYFFAVFLTVLAVYFVIQEASKGNMLIYSALGCVLLAAALGIYQGYLGIACCLMAVYILIQFLFMGNDRKEMFGILKRAMRMLGVLIGGFILYYIINNVFLAIRGLEMNQSHVSGQLGEMGIGGIIKNISMCYQGILQIVKGDFYGISNVGIFRIVFALCIFITAGACVIGIGKKVKDKNWIQALAILIILIIYPIGMNCVLLLTGGEGVHTLMTYAVVVVFMIPILMWNYITIKKKKNTICFFWKGLAIMMSILLFLLSGSNILQANKAYRKMDMANQYAVSYLTTMITQIKSLAGYQDEMPILFVGSVLDRQDSTFSGYEKGWGDVNDMMGVFDAHLMANAAFLEYFCGFKYEVPENAEELRNSDVVKNMPYYPDYGSVMICGDVVVVKLSE